jgi:hypothetical protein
VPRVHRLPPSRHHGNHPNLNHSEKQLQLSRVLGIGIASTLLAVDLVNVPKGRISGMYLQGAACEMFFLAAWARNASQPS